MANLAHSYGESNSEINDAIEVALNMLKPNYEFSFDAIPIEMSQEFNHFFTQKISVDKSLFKTWQKSFLAHYQNGIINDHALNGLYYSPIKNFDRVDMVMYLYANPDFNQLQSFKTYQSEDEQDLHNKINDLFKGFQQQEKLDVEITPDYLFNQFLVNAKDLAHDNSIKVFNINQLADFEKNPYELIGWCLNDLAIEKSEQSLYLMTLARTTELNEFVNGLLYVNDDQDLSELMIHKLAIMVAIDWIYYQLANSQQLQKNWLNQINSASKIIEGNQHLLERAFVWHELLNKSQLQPTPN